MVVSLTCSVVNRLTGILHFNRLTINQFKIFGFNRESTTFYHFDVFNVGYHLLLTENASTTVVRHSFVYVINVYFKGIFAG